MRTVKLANENISKLRSALAVALALWCAGAGCMMVSYAHARAMSDTVAANTGASQAGSGESSASMASHHCCKARHATEHRAAASTNHDPASDSFAKLAERADVPNSSNAMNCCPLTSGTFVVSGPQRIVNENASMFQDVDGTPAVSNSDPPPLAIPLRLLNQNQTYLRGCVFLI